MKTLKHVVMVLALVVFAASQANAQIITGYGTGDYLPGFTTFTGTQTATSYEISGADNNSAFGNLQTSVLVNTPTALTLLANYSTGTSTAPFNIELFDSNGNGVLYSASLNSFTPHGSNVAINLLFAGQDELNSVNFNGTVSSIQFLAGGTATATFDMILDNLSVATATPEPSSMALMLIGGLVLFGGARVLRKAKA